MPHSTFTYIANGIAAFLFSSTGPVAIILTVAAASGLSNQHIASWLFGGFAIGGAYTLYFTLRYRQPIAFAWTIPGTVLLLSALDHLPFAEVVGAYIVTALLILVIGLSGQVERIMQAIPKPIIMGMVAGIFLDFGLNIVHAFSDSLAIASSMVVAFVMFQRIESLRRLVPPILASLCVGAVVVIATDAQHTTGEIEGVITIPVLFVPQFSLQACLELVIPLAVTVIAVQNAQGFAVLTHAGHRPPIDKMTVACGTGSLILAMIGTVTMCVTGPSNAILSSSGKPEKQYIGGITYAVLAILFGTFGALMTWIVLKLPDAYIAVLGGLAVIKVLESSFIAAFSDTHSLGALVTLLITVSNISIFNIGAPFWGLVFGLLVSFILEKRPAHQ